MRKGMFRPGESRTLGSLECFGGTRRDMNVLLMLKGRGMCVKCPNLPLPQEEGLKPLRERSRLPRKEVQFGCWL